MRETVLLELESSLAICVDCLGWSQYGPTDPNWEYSEGYSGPEEPLLSADLVIPPDGEPHYSSRPCEGCGSGLAGDRLSVTVYVREERAVSAETVVTLTVRATVDTEQLARHLTTDPERQRIIREGAAAEALVAHLRPMLEDPCWDSPAVLRVTAAVSERRGE